MPKNQKKDMRSVTGIININRRGVGYVVTPELTQDVEISPRDLNTALPGDTVSASLHSQDRGRWSGKVESVIARARDRFVGVLSRKGSLWYLVPDDRRMYTDILIPHAPRVAREGFKALLRLTHFTDPKRDPEGEIIKIIGKKGEHNVEMESIVLSKGFSMKFADELMREAKEMEGRRDITADEISRRCDMRDIETFTIDPSDAKDFDDAVSYRETAEGIEIGIHIADVSHYVRPGSAIDREAQERGTSIYLVDRTIPMLPEVLSNDVCSLNPREDKLTYSAVFIVDQRGHVMKRWFGETVIHSDHRFTYEEAQEVIDSRTGLHYRALQSLNQIAYALREERFKRGSILFDRDEVKFELDAAGVPLGVAVKKRLDTHLLIEDLMLLANREIAAYFHSISKKMGVKDRLFVYRIHDVPNPEKIEELNIFLRALGYEFNSENGAVDAKEINRLFKKIEGKPEEDLIKVATIRAMAKAVYATKNIGHFGLAFKYYTHFTSPIRRYPDVMVHRILKRHFEGKPLTKAEMVRYERLVIQSSEREASAVEAERESIKYKQVEYMKEHVGDMFNGVISGVTEWGLYVEETETKAEGLVPIRTLANDYYILERDKFRLIGERTKKTYTLGDRVRMKLLKADLEERILDWELVEHKSHAPSSRKSRTV